MHFAIHDLEHLLRAYGYWAVLFFVAIESTGIPFPGETMLLIASIYAGTTHNLSIPLVILAAAVGAIIGDNIGFWVGREGGFRLLARFGHVVHLDEAKIKVGQYLFMRHGGKVVFFGRFVSILRAWAAFLAGVNRMGWLPFLFFNGAGAILWAVIYGLGGYILGNSVRSLSIRVGIILLVIAVIVILVAFVVVVRGEHQLEKEAEAALPGPVEGYVRGRGDAKK